MEKTWLKHYPKGVPASIDVEQYTSLVALIEESFKKYRDLPAYKFMGKTITFGQVDDLSRAFAAYLQAQGFARGDRIAIMMPNVPQYPVAVAAILRAGYVVVNVNPLYTPRELEHQLKDSGAKAIVMVENFATTLQQVLPNVPAKKVILTALGDMLATTTCLTGVAGSTACSVAAKFSRMTMASAPLSFNWCSSSRGVYSGLTLTTT